MLLPVQHVDMLACFDIAVTFDAIMAVGTACGPRHSYVHIRNHVPTGDLCSAIRMQIATSDRPYPIAPIMAVDLEIRDR
jgi:hypothetical protein